MEPQSEEATSMSSGYALPGRATIIDEIKSGWDLACGGGLCGAEALFRILASI